MDRKPFVASRTFPIGARVRSRGLRSPAAFSASRSGLEITAEGLGCHGPDIVFKEGFEGEEEGDDGEGGIEGSKSYLPDGWVMVKRPGGPRHVAVPGRTLPGTLCWRVLFTRCA